MVINKRKIKRLRHVARVEKRIRAYRALVGKPEEKTWKACKWIGG
jgi:hypothetical protein